MKRLPLPLFVLLLAWGGACPGPYLEHQPTRHIEEQFRIAGDRRTFIRHVFIPVEHERDGSPESRDILAIVAGEIRNEADLMGYTEGPSGPHYARELDLLAKGYWPLTYITVAGQWPVLMHMAFAIRWDDTPLPWETRFLDDDLGFLPARIETEHKTALGTHEFPKFQHYKELNTRANRDQLRLLGLMRYEMVGERTEFKFLGGREPSLPFLRELLHAASEYGLHKHSRRTPDEKVLAGFQRALGNYPVDERLVRAVAREMDSPHSEVIEEFMVKFLTDPSLQPFVANSGVYGHISAEPRGEMMTSPRAALLERRLQLPPSLYSFLEGPGIGKIGIRTDITAVTTAYFETHVLRSLDANETLANKPAIYLDAKDWVPGAMTCGAYLSTFEKALYDFHRSRE